jgi:putative transposase
MKKSKFTESQITASIKAYEAGKDVQQICRELKINRATFYNWKKKYGGLGVWALRELRQLKNENTRLKQMVAHKAYAS